MARALSSPPVVTGIGVVSGLGIGGATFNAALASGASALAPVRAFDTSACEAHLAGEVVAFDPGRFVSPARLRRIDRTGQLAVMATGLALEDAGALPAPGAGSDEIGVALGSYTTGLHSLVDYLDRLNALGPIGASALDFSNTVGNAAASLCGLEFGLRGPNVTLSYREASGLAAVAYGISLLRSGHCQAVVSGGVDDFERVFFAVHDRLGVLAHDAGCGEASRPFDARRNGFVLGSGAYLVTVETAERAARRGAEIRGAIMGVGGASGRGRRNHWPTDPAPLARAMRQAMDAANVAPADVAAIFASANSTPALDRVEAAAIADIFGPSAVPVVSVKGALGECGAASAASLVAALGALSSGTLPPTLGFARPDPACPVDVVCCRRSVNAARPRFLVNGVATGGTCYSLVVGHAVTR